MVRVSFEEVGPLESKGGREPRPQREQKVSKDLKVQSVESDSEDDDLVLTMGLNEKEAEQALEINSDLDIEKAEVERQEIEDETTTSVIDNDVENEPSLIRPEGQNVNEYVEEVENQRVEVEWLKETVHRDRSREGYWKPNTFEWSKPSVSIKCHKTNAAKDGRHFM